MCSYEEKAAYNRRKYKTIIFRVRRDSELAEMLEESANGEYSQNFVITAALCNYFKCGLPHRQYTRTKREVLIDCKEA